MLKSLGSSVLSTRLVWWLMPSGAKRDNSRYSNSCIKNIQAHWYSEFGGEPSISNSAPTNIIICTRRPSSLPSPFWHTLPPTTSCLDRSSLSATSRCSRTTLCFHKGLRRRNWIKSTVDLLGFGAFFAEWTCALTAYFRSTGVFSIGYA